MITVSVVMLSCAVLIVCLDKLYISFKDEKNANLPKFEVLLLNTTTVVVILSCLLALGITASTM